MHNPPEPFYSCRRSWFRPHVWMVGVAVVAGMLNAQVPTSLSANNGPLVSQLSPIIINAHPAGTQTSSQPEKPELIRSQQGPWGKLEYFPVFLEAPAYLVDKFPLPSSKSRWAYPLTKEESFQAFLVRSGLSVSEAESVVNSPGHTSDAQMGYYFPPIPLVESLTPEVRGVIYHELRHYPENEFQTEPVLITNGNVEDWFKSSGLRSELVDLIKKMTYMRGDTLAFSDVAVLIHYSAGEAESKLILKSLTRTRTLVAKLLLDEHSNIESMMNYWTTGMNLRRKDIEPMLYSVIDTRGVDALDIIHLLPALPRKLLLTYPDMSMGLEGIFPDCHWTSLNFFNYNPQPYLLDSRLATTAVLERFNPVEAPYKFGDILFFLDAKTGDAFHSCVYLADDIVFTKNGRNLLSPWVLMKIDDVKRVYLFDGNGRIQAYRNKKAPAMIDGMPVDGK